MNTGDVTRMLRDLPDGSTADAGPLWGVVHAELRRLADRFLRGESPAHTLQPTALVHEAYLRILRGRPVAWRDRRHFFAVAARAMRRILIDHARKARAAKRGGGHERVDLTRALGDAAHYDACLIALDEALADLAELDSELAEVVELRFFGGLTIEETAELQGVAPITIQRRWRAARGWLYRQITGDPIP